MQPASCVSTEDNCVLRKPALCYISCISTQKEKSGWQSSLIPDASTTMLFQYMPADRRHMLHSHQHWTCSSLCSSARRDISERLNSRMFPLLLPHVSISSEDLGYRTFLLSSLLPSSSTHSSICFSSSNPSTRPVSSRGQSPSGVGQTQPADPSPNPLLP